VLLREYMKPYPGNKLCLEVRNIGIQSVELREVTLEEIPPELRDTRGLAEKLKKVELGN